VLSETSLFLSYFHPTRLPVHIPRRFYAKPSPERLGKCPPLSPWGR